MENKMNCECNEKSCSGATYNFYNTCKCGADEKDLKMDLLFHGTADELGAVYDLNAPITDYSALIVESGLYGISIKYWSVGYMFIPFPQLSNGDIRYHQLLHMTVGNSVRRWIVNWYLPTVSTFTISALSIGEGADGNSSDQVVAIRKIYGIK